MKIRPFLIHALSPLHAGTGQAADVIDLPIARMKATGIPIVPGSSIKGVLRDARRESAAGQGAEAQARVEAVFGPSDNPEAHGGALVVGDARLMALPVRSFRGTFSWVTSPLLLLLARRDIGAGPAVPGFTGRGARVTPESMCLHKGHLYLEDLDLPAAASPDIAAWAKALAPLISPGQDVFSPRLAVVDDETMTFLWETATQLDARVRIDPSTGTVAQRALWLEESLPPESVLLGLLAAERSRRPKVAMTPDEVLALALGAEEDLQVGGKATTGRGRCRLIPWPEGVFAGAPA